MRTLLVINARTDSEAAHAVRDGRSPRKDYFELQSSLDADIIDLSSLAMRPWTRLLQRLLGSSMAQATLAGLAAGGYDAIFADRESTGFALAMLLKLRRRRPRLIMLGHLLSPPKKQLIFRLLRLRTSIDRVVVHSSLQQSIARDRLNLRSSQIALIPYHSDARFWAPRRSPSRRLICSAGLEYRDHRTLIAAVRDLDVEVVIAASSRWSKHSTLNGVEVPGNVCVSSFDYQPLRDLYDQSLFVVVPLLDSDNQAGITTILEAMAMGKAVIVSHSRGQIDVVRDRRRLNRFLPDRPTQPDWARHLGAPDSIAEGQTGIYVRPGDVAELRRAIEYLLNHPEEARAMGENGRRLVLATMSLDHYVARLTSIIRGDAVPTDDSAQSIGIEQPAVTRA